jgi:hypothetical protein
VVMPLTSRLILYLYTSYPHHIHIFNGC